MSLDLGGTPPGGLSHVSGLFSASCHFGILQNHHSKGVVGKFVQSNGLRLMWKTPGIPGFFCLLYSL